ncbi:putative metalloprotease CJM1_0395 family protein [Arenibaculum sp.]|jgi:hypothetical protein|uniref:putative metalloprotease CJM1_0395 family protein n=1 Tax=Arenibaculum sp. TaxID=2865862 RepID=UPI002E0D9A8E|nr:putative metalloprotease CJM1_0395 family protein [Arenibaculum sp.]
MFGAGSATQLLANARPPAVGGMPPVGAVRGVFRDDGERRAGERERQGAGGFGPAVIVSLRGGGDARSPQAEERPGELPPEEQEMVKELEVRDREVRTHEMAHMAAGGQYASGPSYTYRTGPDGRRYAIGGEVQIDTSPEKTPEETIRKMDVVKRAALAPAEPSAQDMRVAQLADQQRNQAQAELNGQRTEEMMERIGGADKADTADAAGRTGSDAASGGNGEAGRFAAATAAYGGAAKLFVDPAVGGGSAGAGFIGLF